MNKFLLVAFALSGAFYVVHCDSSEEVLEKVKSKHIRKFLSERRDVLDSGYSKIEEKCPGVKDKIKEAIKAFEECEDKVDDSLTVCESLQANALNCTKPLLKVVDDCLPEAARGLPKLGIKGALSALKFLCAQPGESLFELLNPCIWEDPAEGNEQLNECEKTFLKAVEKYKDTIPSPSQICTDITPLRSCLQTHLTATCKNSKTRNVALGLYDAIAAPCSHLNEV